MASQLNIPKTSGSTVDVSVIPAGQVTVPSAFLLKQPLPGHDIYTAPCYSFLVEHKEKGKKILFDLGPMKAWKEKFPPAILAQVEMAKNVFNIEKDVPDYLREADIPLESINAIVWSHHHIDHTGDPSLFPSSTSLLVGPGFKSDKTTFPGYPKNPDALVPDDGFQGREVIELDFSATGLTIGGFPAIDYFGDGSFYLLQTKGHTHYHVSALARTSASKFLFLAGDIAHHVGEFRPSTHLPLPNDITPSPLDPTPLNPRLAAFSACPGSILSEIHPKKETDDYRTTPFYEPHPLMNVSPAEAAEAVGKMQVFDGDVEVFVVIAHDQDLLDILPAFPEKITKWDLEGYKSLGRWRFLRDFLKGAQ
ncbi:metallo-beta-lactamase superfamily protein [Aspergillus crustosus]